MEYSVGILNTIFMHTIVVLLLEGKLQQGWTDGKETRCAVNHFEYIWRVKIFCNCLMSTQLEDPTIKLGLDQKTFRPLTTIQFSTMKLFL